ncbi:hypothetical protein [Caballeronia udeis]|uniref:hypothetical protein n=1 Tax=Caballeronia udeis TaxID=1232866 RepID=UPI0007845AE7|nr:hypothetical protein [Caballeronia udeis]
MSELLVFPLRTLVKETGDPDEDGFSISSRSKLIRIPYSIEKFQHLKKNPAQAKRLSGVSIKRTVVLAAWV